MGKFLLGFLHYAPPYPCHSRCAVYFNTIEPALFAQSASGYFSSSGQKYWFRLKIQPESIQAIIMASGFRRYVSFVFATLFFVVIHHGAKATNSMAQPHNIACKIQKHPDVRSADASM